MKENEIADLHLKLKNMKVEDDKNNNLNINQRLTELFDTLVKVEKK